MEMMKVKNLWGRRGMVLLALLVMLVGCGFESETEEAGLGPALWPQWVFEHWVWYNESTQEEAVSLVEEYLAHEIPVGAVIIDSPWETGYNTFEWDPNLYPDPQGMVDWFHARNVRVVLWITSVINAACPGGAPSCPEKTLYEEGMMRHYFMGDGTLIPWWKCPDDADFCGALIDYFNPQAVEWWHRLMDPVLDLGIDGWKCDGTDPFAILATISPYAGTTHPWDYSDRYYRDFFEYTRKRLGNDRVIMARPVDSVADLSEYGLGGITILAPFAPRDVNFAGWVGDQDSTFEGLQAALMNMYYSALSRSLLFGSDIGGFRDRGRTKELFVRWAQLGALCSLMENGGNGEHRPWMYDEETLHIYRRFVNLHYKLIPYMNREARRAYYQGISLMQVQKTAPEKEIYKWEYLLGPDLLVAPIYESGNTRLVHFPEGDDWVYLWDRSQVYKGGTEEPLYFPLAEFPVFVRKGSKLERDRNLP